MAMKMSNLHGQLLFVVLLAVLVAGCAGDAPKPVTSVANHNVTFEIKKCKRVQDNLECTMRFKTLGMQSRFYIGTDKALVPTATDDQGRSYTATELYINGAEQMNRWYTMSTFKDLPGIIVFPSVAADAKTVTRLVMPVATHKINNPDQVVFSYLKVDG